MEQLYQNNDKIEKIIGYVMSSSWAPNKNVQELNHVAKEFFATLLHLILL